MPVSPTTPRVALVGEGTYPVVRGGVSTWTHQLVTMLADHDFHVHALTSGEPELAYELPPNVRSWSAYDIWGPVATRRGPSRAVRAEFNEAWEQVLAAAFHTPSAPGPDLHAAWRTLCRPAITERIWQLVNARDAIAILSDRRVAAGLRPATSRELVESAAFLARMMLPLGQQLPEVDVVHATSNGPSSLLGIRAAAQGTPFVVSEHGVYLRERLLALGSTTWPVSQVENAAALIGHLVWMAYQTCSLVLPVSDFNGRWAMQVGAAPERVQTVYNGVDPGVFSISAEPEQPIVVFVGRIDPLKDLETMIRAMGLVVAQVPQAQLHLYGPVPAENGAYAAHLHSTVDELGLAANVRFAGPTSDPAAAYATGQVVAMSSISEGFPYGAIEPMACGRPVVATSVGGVPEAVGDAGMLTRAKDPRGLADALTLLLNDPEERAALARRGRRRVEQRFTLAGMADQYRSVYAGVARLPDSSVLQSAGAGR